VPIDYDPLLAKIIGYAPTRREAIARLDRAMYEYFVGGIKTNISLFRRILRDPEFIAGKVDTSFLDRLLERQPAADDAQRNGQREVAALAAALFAQMEAAAPVSSANGTQSAAEAKESSPASGWKRAGRMEGLRER
jgi:acetyl-CoA carboxylase biotin carboxylase subunit